MADKKLPAIMIATPSGVAYYDTHKSAMDALSVMLLAQMVNPEARQSLKVSVYDRYTIIDNSPALSVDKIDE